MKITVLIENTSDSELLCEHGLSLFIEHNGRNYLLDAGQSGAFMENAEKLQIPLMATDTCILSHGHYDHAGGFARYLRSNPDAVVYAMRDVGCGYYSESGGIHAIGVPRDVLPTYEKQFRYIERMTEIADGVYLLPHDTKGLEKTGMRAGLFRKEGAELVGDDFRHELSLVIDTKSGLVVCNSCSHAGIRNILREVEQAFPHRSVYAFIGGLHMKGKCEGREICTFSEEEIRELSEYLVEKGVRYLYTGHCTGAPGYSLLKMYLGERVQPLGTGSVIKVDE